MFFLKRKTLNWATLNLTGLAIYARIKLPLTPEDGGAPGPGDGFYFLFAMLPILLAFLTMNLAALFAIVRAKPSSRKRIALALWWGMAIAWQIAFW